MRPLLALLTHPIALMSDTQLTALFASTLATVRQDEASRLEVAEGERSNPWDRLLAGDTIDNLKALLLIVEERQRRARLKETV